MTAAQISIELGARSRPYSLSYKGAFPTLAGCEMCAVVGWRRADDEALLAVAGIVGKLNRRNIVVVTGMARGVDRTAYAHATKCIGVLPQGIDDFNAGACRSRLANGTFSLVSEFGDSDPLDAKRAMQRNMTIARLARRVVVGSISDGELSSGTWNMVKFCLNERREHIKLYCLNPNALSRWNPSRVGLSRLVELFQVQTIDPF